MKANAMIYDGSKRPSGNNADEWAVFLEEHLNSLPFLAVQIAEAIDDAAATRKEILTGLKSLEMLGYRQDGAPANAMIDRAAIIEDLADAFEAFVTTDDEYGDQEFGQFCQEHHAEILSALRGQPSCIELLQSIEATLEAVRDIPPNPATRMMIDEDLEKLRLAPAAVPPVPPFDRPLTEEEIQRRLRVAKTEKPAPPSSDDTELQNMGLVFDKVGNPAPPSTPEREKLLELLKLSASRFRCDIGFLKGSQQIYDRLIAAIAALEGKS